MLQALSSRKSSILVVSAVLAVGLFLSRHLVGPFSGGGASVGPVSPETAAEHAGERAEVCGTVTEVAYAPDVGGRPTFINMGGTHPHQAFTAVLWGDQRRRWDPAPETQYEGRKICVTGTVQLHDGTPQIVVSTPQQIRTR